MEAGFRGVSVMVKSGASTMVGDRFASPDWAHELGHRIKRLQRPVSHPALPCPGPARLSVSDNGTDLAEKADTAMYVDDEGRIDAAEQLAEHDPRAAAEAFSAIACDQAVGDEVRLSAAELLADVDPRAAAPACLAITCDEAVGDEVRLSAAELLADVDPRAAAPACLAIACDEAVGDSQADTTGASGDQNGLSGHERGVSHGLLPPPRLSEGIRGAARPAARIGHTQIVGAQLA